MTHTFPTWIDCIASAVQHQQAGSIVRNITRHNGIWSFVVA